MADPSETKLDPEPSGQTPDQPGRVIALRCRGCSALVPTEQPEDDPRDGMQARCPTCGTTTVWREYAVVDRPEQPAGQPGRDGPDAGQVHDPDAEATAALLRGATPRDAGVTAARAKELKAKARTGAPGRSPDPTPPHDGLAIEFTTGPASVVDPADTSPSPHPAPDGSSLPADPDPTP